MRSEEWRRYARLYSRILEPFLIPLRREIVHVCRSAGIQSVLDIGCGTGAQCAALRKAGLNSKGLDISSSMVGAAGTRFGNNELIRGDARCLPFADQSEDAVVLCLMLHSIPQADRLKVLQEACRVGRIVVLADYRNAERNLDGPAVLLVRCVEYLAGREHRALCRDFYKRNAVEGIVALLREGLPEQQSRERIHTTTGQGGPRSFDGLLLRRPTLGGAASLIVWKSNR